MKLDRFYTWRWGVCFVAVFLLVVGLAWWQDQPSLLPAVQPLPQDPTIQVFFNQSEAHVYTDPDRGIERYGDNLEQVILEAIATAHQSIDLAVQELNLPRVAQALQTKAEAGVEVRLILENQYSQPWSRRDRTWAAQQNDYTAQKYENWLAFSDRNQDGQISETEAATYDALLILQNAQLPMLDDTADGTKGTGLMHHKFLIIDHRQLVMGSANFTLSDIHGDTLSPVSRGNANVLLSIHSPELAQLYTQEFNLMWGDGPGGQPDSLFGAPKPLRAPQRLAVSTGTITVMFSPQRADTPWQQTTNGLIDQTLQKARKSVDLALFVFSEQGIANVLEAKAKAGVHLRVLIDPGFVYRNYSEALDMMGLALPDHRCRYEKNNHPWPLPITEVGFPTLPEGDKLHHKFALIDQQTVIIGSHNWSKAANTQNDESLFVIENSTVAKHFQQEFERLYKQANIGQTDYLQHQIRKLSVKCG